MDKLSKIKLLFSESCSLQVVRAICTHTQAPHFSTRPPFEKIEGANTKPTSLNLKVYQFMTSS